MSTLNVKVPEEMESDIEAFLDEHPHYLNKSELVRDAVRHMIEEPRLSDMAREDIRVSRRQIKQGENFDLDGLK